MKTFPDESIKSIDLGSSPGPPLRKERRAALSMVSLHTLLPIDMQDANLKRDGLTGASHPATMKKTIPQAVFNALTSIEKTVELARRTMEIAHAGIAFAYRMKLMARLAGSILLCFTFTSNATGTPAEEALALRSKYTSMAPRLEQNPFNRPLVLDSIEGNDQLKGEIYAVMNFPFVQLKSALSDPVQWCEVMILHFNTKYCHANTGGAGPVLQVNIGKKTPQTLGDSESIALKFSVLTTTPEYVDIALAAQQGPLGSSDYRITLQAVSLPGSKTFIQLTYSYATGWAARVAMRAYLATLGRGKVGFTVTGRDRDGQIEYVGGVRGVIERNTMRYFLAIDSYLDSIAEPRDAQFEKRLHSWFFASEQYSRQLHEMSWEQYVEMKFAEHARMLREP